jgi:integrase/recombinase XerD
VTLKEKNGMRQASLALASWTKQAATNAPTRNWQRRALDEVAHEHGAKPVAMMAARHVKRIRDVADAAMRKLLP